MSVTESHKGVATAKILHKPSLQLQHVGRRRGTEKATTRGREGRDQQEGQGVATSHGGAVSRRLGSVGSAGLLAGTQLSEGKTPAINTSLEIGHTWTHVQLHSSHFHTTDVHKRCTSVLF